jgi:rubrerythrin
MPAFTAADALSMALEIEKNGESYYEAVAAKDNSDDVQALFEDLANQERIHYKVFRDMLEDVSSNRKLTDDAMQDYGLYVEAALGNALFAEDRALSMAEGAASTEEALRAALGFEKDTLLFFYDLREMVAEKDRDAITQIISEEKRHVRRLAMML